MDRGTKVFKTRIYLSFRKKYNISFGIYYVARISNVLHFTCKQTSLRREFIGIPRKLNGDDGGGGNEYNLGFIPNKPAYKKKSTSVIERRSGITLLTSRLMSSCAINDVSGTGWFSMHNHEMDKLLRTQH